MAPAPRRSQYRSGGKLSEVHTPLAKGKACSTCKARKVRCNAGTPACSACRRTARFEGRDPDLVVCGYGKACGVRPSRGGMGHGEAVPVPSHATTPAVSAKRSSTASRGRLASAELGQNENQATPFLATPSPPLPTLGSISPAPSPSVASKCLLPDLAPASCWFPNKAPASTTSPVISSRALHGLPLSLPPLAVAAAAASVYNQPGHLLTPLTQVDYMMNTAVSVDPISNSTIRPMKLGPLTMDWVSSMSAIQEESIFASSPWSSPWSSSTSSTSSSSSPPVYSSGWGVGHGYTDSYPSSCPSPVSFYSNYSTDSDLYSNSSPPTTSATAFDLDETLLFPPEFSNKDHMSDTLSLPLFPLKLPPAPGLLSQDVNSFWTENWDR